MLYSRMNLWWKWAVWSIARKEWPSLLVSLSGSFQVLGGYCRAVGPGLLDFHSRHSWLNFGGEIRSRHEFIYVFLNYMMRNFFMIFQMWQSFSFTSFVRHDTEWVEEWATEKVKYCITQLFHLSCQKSRSYFSRTAYLTQDRPSRHLIDRGFFWSICLLIFVGSVGRSAGRPSIN